MRRTLAAFILALLMITPAAAAPEAGTRDEAVAMVKRVQQKFAHDGPQATFDAVSHSNEFRDRDLYAFIFDAEGWSIANGANPQMVGKLWISTKDQDGNYVVKEMLAIARDFGSGWVNYKWPNPLTHKIQDKSVYVEKLGDQYFVGAGIYLQ